MLIQTLPFHDFHFFADQLDSPNSADWAINALAPLSADSNNNGLPVRLFDDTTEEGIGLLVKIPEDATNIIIDLISRAETAPGDPDNVQPRIYVREFPDNAAPESWSSGLNMTIIVMPANENWQYDSQEISLSTLGLVAGRIAQFELTRYNSGVSDNLSGDWTLLQIKISFS